MRVRDFLPALSEYLDPRWRVLLPNSAQILEKLENEIDFSQSVPSKELIFKAFECNPKDVSVVIFGQDPYPNQSHAMGLAFSVTDDVSPLPASLRNIFLELISDIGGDVPNAGDLSYLSEQGVMLLNRGLTLDLKAKKVHPVWYEFTDEVAQVLAKLGVVGIFWGKQAQELAKYFPVNKRILGVHPSPLSAYKGFFGSKPFSKANEILLADDKTAINWTEQ
jgi:uracil-DNA glycosylase